MSQTAAHLVDHVIQRVPVRQWVPSMPIPLRLLLAAKPLLVPTASPLTHAPGRRCSRCKVRRHATPCSPKRSVPTSRASACTRDRLARRHHAPRDVAAGVHAAAGCAGAAAQAAPHSVPWGAGAQRQAAGHGGAAGLRGRHWLGVTRPGVSDLEMVVHGLLAQTCLVW
jgi:hypothetical protein